MQRKKSMSPGNDSDDGQPLPNMSGPPSLATSTHQLMPDLEHMAGLGDSMMPNRSTPASSTNTTPPSASAALIRITSDVQDLQDLSGLGLSSSTVAHQHAVSGYNEIPEHRPPLALRIARQFIGVTPCLLEATIIVSCLPHIEKYAVAAIVAMLLVLNAVIAVVQESHAAGAVRALRARLVIEVVVRRDGGWTRVPAREIVVGDVFRVDQGSFLPADAIILSQHTSPTALSTDIGAKTRSVGAGAGAFASGGTTSSSISSSKMTENPTPADAACMEVDQSALTGESKPIKRGPGDTVYSGSVVAAGEATCRAVAVGATTRFGKTIDLVTTSAPRTHMDAVMTRMTVTLAVAVGVTLGVTVGIVAVRAQLGSSAAAATAAGSSSVVATPLSPGQAVLAAAPLVLMLLTSAVPVALPTMILVAGAMASVELGKKGVLITRLHVTEDAAGMNVLCSDKTGTLTANEQTIVKIVTGSEEVSETDVITCGMMACPLEKPAKLDTVFTKAAESRGITTISIPFVQLSYTPFDYKNRRTEASIRLVKPRHDAFIHTTASNKNSNATTRPNESGDRGTVPDFLVTKGAVTTILDLCDPANMPSSRKQLLIDQEHEFGKKGYRTMAVARAIPDTTSQVTTKIKGDGETQKWVYHLVGLTVIADPPRHDARHTVAALRALGVRVKMLTGDALPVAQEIARLVGLGPDTESLAQLRAKIPSTTAGSGVVLTPPLPAGNSPTSQAVTVSKATTADQVQVTKKDPSNADALFEKVDVDAVDGFAGIFPEDKHAIVKALQKRGLVVGMTGDGVNDSPALKLAEVGVAVANAADVAKGAASAVLLSEGLSGILDLIRVSRQTHQRIETWILNKIIKTFQQVVFVVLGYLITGQFIVSPVHLVVLLFLIDFVTVALATDAARPSDQPSKWRMKQLTIASLVMSVLSVLESLFVLYFAMFRIRFSSNSTLSAVPFFAAFPSDDASIRSLNTFMFEWLFFFGMCTLLIVRERSWFFRSTPSWQLLVAVLVDAILMIFLGTTGFPEISPIPSIDIAYLMLFAMAFGFIINDCFKVVLFRTLKLS